MSSVSAIGISADSPMIVPLRFPTVVNMRRPNRWAILAASMLMMVSVMPTKAMAADADPPGDGGPAAYVVCEILPIFWWCKK